MKNITLSILVVACGALVSCGPSNYAANGNGGYVNSIYYTSSDAGTSTSEQPYIAQDVTNLKEKTSSAYKPATTTVETVKVDTIYMGENDLVQVDYQPGTQYVVVDGEESYEVLLKKFDSPTYVVNVSVDPWDYAWYGASSLYWGWPTVYGSRYGWHSPIYWRGYWGWNWRWYDPWFLGWGSWYDPWYYSWNWYSPWYYGYYDHWYWGHRDPWRYDHGRGGYHPGHRPGHREIRPGAHRSDPGRYYTRRNGVNSSRPGRPNVGVASKGNVNPRPTATQSRANGSSYRRNSVNQVRGTSMGRPNGRPQFDNNRNNGGRTPSSSARTNVVGRSNSNNVRPATYSRGNVSSTRGSYTPSSRSNSGNRTTVTRPGSSVSRPGSANRSSSGGGVYRPASTRTTYSSGSGSRGTYSGGRSYSSGRSYSTSSPRSSGYSGGNSGGGYSSSSSSGRSSGGSYSGGGSSHSSSSGGGSSSSRSGGSSTRR